MGATEAVAAASGGVWEFYRDERGVSVVKIELNGAGGSETERAMILAEVKRVMRAALEARLKPYVDLKHICRNPLLLSCAGRSGMLSFRPDFGVSILDGIRIWGRFASH